MAAWFVSMALFSASSKSLCISSNRSLYSLRTFASALLDAPSYCPRSSFTQLRMSLNIFFTLSLKDFCSLSVSLLMYSARVLEFVSISSQVLARISSIASSSVCLLPSSFGCFSSSLSISASTTRLISPSVCASSVSRAKSFILL